MNVWEISISHKNKDGTKTNYTNVGVAFEKEFQGDQVFSIVLDPGVSIASVQGAFINMRKKKPRGEQGGFNP